MKKFELETIQTRTASSSDDYRPNVKCHIKLTSYNDEDDVAIYLNVFECVRDANQWGPEVALSALVNGFAGTKVGHYMNSLNSNVRYDEVKLQLIKSLGYTIYDYQNKFNNVKQGKEFFRQYVLLLRKNLSHMCKLASVCDDFSLLVENR